MMDGRIYSRLPRKEGPVILPEAALPAWVHPHSRSYLTKRGVTPNEAEFYGLLFTDSGYWKNRILIPFYGEAGALRGYQGRHIHDIEPRYITSGKRPVYCPWDEAADNKLCIVEGFFDLVAVNRVIPTVATLGTMVSDAQFEELKHLITRYTFQRIVIWFDNDAAGLERVFALQLRLAPHVETEVIQYGETKDPGEATPQQIQEALSL